MNDYLILTRETGRARMVPEVEGKNAYTLALNDKTEATKVLAFYVKAIQKAASALIQGKLHHFDAVIGDHACQVPAYIVLRAFQDPEILAEAQTLHVFTPPKCPEGLPRDTLPSLIPSLSEKMSFLVRAFILCSGKEFSVNPTGAISLKLTPQRIEHSIGLPYDKEILRKIITHSKLQMNRECTSAIQALATKVLVPEEAACLSAPRTGVTLLGDHMLFPCAFYSVKAVFTDLVNAGGSFAFVHAKTKKIVYIQSPAPGTPLLAIEAHFENLEAIRLYGLIPFALASIATKQQFEDACPCGEDLELLPPEQSRDVALHRQTGEKLLSLMRIVHVYATVAP